MLKKTLIKDLADLVTTILIIAGLSVTAILAIGGITYATRDNARTSAECIANYSALDSVTSIEDHCKGLKDNDEEDNGNDEGNNDEGNNDDEIVEEPLHYTDEKCFITDGSMILGYNINYSDCPKDVVIPEEIRGFPVLSIGYGAFMDTYIGDAGYGITSVVFPKNLESIGGSAFCFNNLKEVVIPNSVKLIQDGAFCSNYELSKVTIGNNVELIGSSAFSMSAISHIDIPDSVVEIKSYAFFAPSLKTVNIGNGVKTIGNNAFSYTEILDIYIPDSVTIIGDNAFSNGKALNSISLPAHLSDLKISSKFKVTANTEITIRD